MKRINISDEIIGEPYKVEDIHNARQTDFEKQVADKRNEFESSINLKKPQPVDFSDKVEPEMKIMEMEALIADTMAKRKFDIEQIQGINANFNADVFKKTVSFNDNVILHVDDYESINLTEIPKVATVVTSEQAKETSNIQYNIFNKLKKTTSVPNKGITEYKTEVQGITEYKTEVQGITETETKLSELNNKIDNLVIMIEKMLLLLERK
jgi:hypothetical protein